MNKYDTVTEAQAEKLGYRLITKLYSKEETGILDKAIATLRGCDFRLVEVVGGIALARHGSELDLILE